MNLLCSIKLRLLSLECSTVMRLFSCAGTLAYTCLLRLPLLGNP